MDRRVVLASSAKPDEVEHYLDLLDARGDAVMVGDSTWDCKAAGNAGVTTIAVFTGGFSEQELTDAGAVAVHRSIEELRQGLARSPLG